MRSPTSLSARPARALAAYVAFVFVGAALGAPWVYEIAQFTASRFPVLQELADSPFHRYVQRLLMLFALAGLWPLLRTAGFGGWRDLGFSNIPNRFGRLWSGFAWGFASLAVVAIAALGAGGHVLEARRDLGEIGRHLVNATLAALVVGFLEEILFRGAIFGMLRKSGSWVQALVISSAIYAWVHFFQRPDPPLHVVWSSGLVTLAQMLRGFVELERLVPGFINLTIVGLILGLAYHRSGGLYFTIGLHAGWIFWLKSWNFISDEAPGASTWIWGSTRMIDGWVALPILLTVLLLVARFPVKLGLKDKETDHGHGSPNDLA